MRHTGGLLKKEWRVNIGREGGLGFEHTSQDYNLHRSRIEPDEGINTN